jgi:hypothetical protein
MVGLLSTRCKRRDMRDLGTELYVGLIRASTACDCVRSVRFVTSDGRGMRGVRAVANHHGHLKSAIAKAT